MRFRFRHGQLALAAFYAPRTGLPGQRAVLCRRILTRAGLVEARQAHERARWAHEGEWIKLQMQAGAAENDAAMRLAETSGAWAGLAASMSAEADRPSLGHYRRGVHRH
ncbi:MAG TPA: hypothetical protein P5341_02695 [Hyphomonas sp.]|nr:hypothetical protein [Hyphomonas sp.]